MLRSNIWYLIWCLKSINRWKNFWYVYLCADFLWLGLSECVINGIGRSFVVALFLSFFLLCPRRECSLSGNQSVYTKISIALNLSAFKQNCLALLTIKLLCSGRGNCLVLFLEALICSRSWLDSSKLAQFLQRKMCLLICWNSFTLATTRWIRESYQM